MKFLKSRKLYGDQYLYIKKYPSKMLFLSKFSGFLNQVVQGAIHHILKKLAILAQGEAKREIRITEGFSK